MHQSIIVKFDNQYTPIIKKIRASVFIEEQQIDEDLDFDGRDPEAIHVLIFENGNAIATGRMLNDGHIGRIAVLKSFRNKGFGKTAILKLIEEATHLGMKRVFLGAQLHAVKFYKKLGFKEYGSTFIDAGIEHIHFEKKI